MLSENSIERIKLKLDFDQVEKTRMTNFMMDELVKMQETISPLPDGDKKEMLLKRYDTIDKYFTWANDIWYKGNAAQNLFLILETMNLNLKLENIELKKQNEELKKEVDKLEKTLAFNAS